MKLATQLLLPIAVLALSACFDPDLDNKGGGFKCPCGKGWYCSEDSGMGHCLKGANTSDSGPRVDLSPGSVCSKFGPERTLPGGEKDIYPVFDLSRDETTGMLAASWSTTSSAGVSIRWALWDGKSWSGGKPLASEGGEATALGVHNIAGAKHVLFYTEPKGKKIKMYASPSRTLVVEANAGLGRYLTATPGRTAGQFFVAFKTAAKNIRVVQWDSTAASAAKAMVEYWDFKGPGYGVAGVGYGLDALLDGARELQLAYFTLSPNRVFVSTLDKLKGTWSHTRPRDTEIKGLDVTKYAGLELSEWGLAFGDHDGSNHKVSYYRDGKAVDLGEGVFPSTDADAKYEAMAHHTVGNAVTFRSRQAGGRWGKSTVDSLALTTRRARVRRSFSKAGNANERLWEVVYRGYDSLDKVYKLHHFTVKCSY